MNTDRANALRWLAIRDALARGCRVTGNPVILESGRDGYTIDAVPGFRAPVKGVLIDAAADRMAAGLKTKRKAR